MSEIKEALTSIHEFALGLLEIEGMIPIRCQTSECKGTVTCFGCYEGDGPVLPACSDCCGHGNEDGWCHPIEEVFEWGEHHAVRAEESEELANKLLTDIAACGVALVRLAKLEAEVIELAKSEEEMVSEEINNSEALLELQDRIDALEMRQSLAKEPVTQMELSATIIMFLKDNEVRLQTPYDGLEGMMRFSNTMAEFLRMKGCC